MIIQGQRVLYDNQLVPAQIHITEEGVIHDISRRYDKSFTMLSDEKVINAGNLVVMPGIVDTHVNIHGPGVVDKKGFETAVKAAAAGGITTIVDMPVNQPTTSVTALAEKIHLAKSNNLINIAFWGGVVSGRQTEINAMLDAGVRGLMATLSPNVHSEFTHCNEEDLHAAYQQLEGTKSVLLFHAEVECPDAVDSAGDLADVKYKKFLLSRPEKMEVEAIKLVIKFCRQYKVRSHITKLSAASALPLIRDAQKEGLPLTVETCHHYLTLTSGRVPDGRTEYKCCPPIRSQENQEALWAAIKDETISMVVSDHSPYPSNLKFTDNGDFMKARSGIANLQLALPLYWTECRRRGFTVSDLSDVMAANTARHAGLLMKVGNNTPRLRGDFVIWDPDFKCTVTKDMLYCKDQPSPYLGMTIYGRVETTIVGGEVVYQRRDGINNKSRNGQLFLADPLY